MILCRTFIYGMTLSRKIVILFNFFIWHLLK